MNWTEIGAIAGVITAIFTVITFVYAIGGAWTDILVEGKIAAKLNQQALITETSYALTIAFFVLKLMGKVSGSLNGGYTLN